MWKHRKRISIFLHNEKLCWIGHWMVDWMTEMKGRWKCRLLFLYAYVQLSLKLCLSKVWENKQKLRFQQLAKMPRVSIIMWSNMYESSEVKGWETQVCMEGNSKNMTGKPNIDYWVSRIPSTLPGEKREGGGPTRREGAILKVANGNFAPMHNNLIKFGIQGSGV